jgi:cytochrome oxidase Cu insertion factor (SCO1/SenC/PrrC family)
MANYVQRAVITAGVLIVAWALWGDYQEKHYPEPEIEVQSSPAIESDFLLTDHNGKSLSNRDLFGKYQLVFFGFTHCPDICPVGLDKISTIMKNLGEVKGEVIPLFITLDPERDTPGVLKEYLQNFSSSIRGLTGSPDAIDQVAKSFKVAYEKETQTTEGEYNVAHSGYLFLMDRNGRNSAIFSDKDSLETIETVIRKQIYKGQ